jgi:hypothetical protein
MEGRDGPRDWLDNNCRFTELDDSETRLLRDPLIGQEVQAEEQHR